MFSGLQVNRIYEQTPKEVKPVNELNQKKLDRLRAELERYRMRINDEGFLRSASEQVQKRHNQKVFICVGFSLQMSLQIITVFFQIQQLELEIRNIRNLTS